LHLGGNQICPATITQFAQEICHRGIRSGTQEPHKKIGWAAKGFYSEGRKNGMLRYRRPSADSG